VRKLPYNISNNSCTGLCRLTSTGDDLHPWGSPLGDPPTLHAHGHDLCLQAHDGDPILPGHPSFLSPLEGCIPGSRISEPGWVCWRCIPNWTCFSTSSHIRHANIQKLPGYQGCSGCNSFSLYLSSYEYTTPVHTILYGSQACSKSGLSVMHRAVSANPFEPKHIWKLYVQALSNIESHVICM